MPSMLSFLIWCSHTETIAYIRAIDVDAIDVGITGRQR